ncbi:hypothetical protein LINGRAHAP2_LOCUS1443 [Linum grandiflorum]
MEQQHRTWIPSHALLHEANSDDAVFRKNQHGGRNHNQQQKQQYQKKIPVSTIDTTPHQPPPYLWPKSSSKNHHHPANKWVGSGGGMRAIFLDSGQKSSTGTGVFLPKRTNNSSSGCSPVLLPARVVQALNLNVNELGNLQLTRRQSDAKNVSNTRHDCNSTTTTTPDPSTKNSIDIIELHNENAPPELIFLPKEWTY